MSECSTRPPLIVAIDGPAGAGKSTVARTLAQRFGLLNLESGAMYRAFAMKALAAGVPTTDAAALDELAHTTEVRLEPGPDGNRVLLDGTDVTPELRTAVVMEGRDIGTVVFPHAPVKIFLDASPEKRGERRYEQNRGTAVATQLPAVVLEEIRERDRRDRTRADSPLRPAPDAVIIDSTDLSLEEVIAKAELLVAQYLGNRE